MKLVDFFDASGALFGPLRGADRPSFQAIRGLLSALPATPTAYMLDPDG
jgi:hypothetical protein